MCAKKVSTLDWTDWATLATAIRTTHSVAVSLVLEPNASTITPTCKVAAYASWPDVSAPELMQVLSVEGVYPTVNHATLDGLIYRLLWELERELCDRYEPLPMFPVGE